MPINIVPPHPDVSPFDAAVVAATPAQLTYRGGPLIKAAEVSVIYLGEGWAAVKPETDAITAFLKTIVPSSYLDDTCAEYNVGHGSFVGEFFMPFSGPPPPPPPPPPPGPDDDSPLARRITAIETYLQSFKPATADPVFAAVTTIDDVEIAQRLTDAIAAGTLPAKTANSLYVVYVQSGVTVTLNSQSAASCRDFCGYHNNSGDLYYGVIPHPDCLGCTGLLAPFDALTSVSTHEIAEAATDPIPGLGWYDDANGENGDICAWKTRSFLGYTVQLEWSNKAGACV